MDFLLKTRGSRTENEGLHTENAGFTALAASNLVAICIQIDEICIKNDEICIEKWWFWHKWPGRDDTYGFLHWEQLRFPVPAPVNIV